MLKYRVVVDSSVRNISRFPKANDFQTDVSALDLVDVVEVCLVYASVPFPEPDITTSRNLLYITGGNSPTCALTRGTYVNAAQLCRELSMSLRRDMGPGFSATTSRLGRVTVASFTPFTITTTSATQTTTDSNGFSQSVPLPGSAASVLGFAVGAPQAAVQAGNKYYAVADNACLSRVDQVAVIRVNEICGVQSTAPVFDRSFAVMHNGREIDPLPTVHANDPSRVAIRTLRVRLLRRDGSLFDTDGRNMTLHLDFIVNKQYSNSRI